MIKHQGSSLVALSTARILGIGSHHRQSRNRHLHIIQCASRAIIPHKMQVSSLAEWTGNLSFVAPLPNAPWMVQMIAFGEDVYIVLQTYCAVLARVDEIICFGPF